MRMQSVQKILKVGSNSRGVTLPARDLEAMNLDKGDEILINYGPVPSDDQSDLLREYNEFKKVYSQTLKNLKDR